MVEVMNGGEGTDMTIHRYDEPCSHEGLEVTVICDVLRIDCELLA